MFLCFFFFFKQKTAYEMRISDWSSDVCSSDLDYFAPLIADGYDIVPLTTSCSLMLKFEWPLLNSANDAIRMLSENTYDLSQYMVALSKECGLAPIDDLPASIGVHFACHSRAQNLGPKAMELLRLIPVANPVLSDRCSGHGGKWDIFKQNFDT